MIHYRVVGIGVQVGDSSVALQNPLEINRITIHHHSDLVSTFELLISSNLIVCAVRSSTTYWCHTHPHNLLHHGVMDSSTVYYS